MGEARCIWGVDTARGRLVPDSARCGDDVESILTPSTGQPRELLEIVDATVDDAVVLVEVHQRLDRLVQEVCCAARAVRVGAGGGVFGGE